jgi:hypothetical protein
MRISFELLVHSSLEVVQSREWDVPLCITSVPFENVALADGTHTVGAVIVE